MLGSPGRCPGPRRCTDVRPGPPIVLPVEAARTSPRTTLQSMRLRCPAGTVVNADRGSNSWLDISLDDCEADHLGWRNVFCGLYANSSGLLSLRSRPSLLPYGADPSTHPEQNWLPSWLPRCINDAGCGGTGRHRWFSSGRAATRKARDGCAVSPSCRVM
jgi:hypothetical protein